VPSPKIDARTVAPAALKVEWPDAYSGKAGVTSNGTQLAAEVAAEFTVFAIGIAWIGRLGTIGILTSQSAIAESARAVFIMANIRTFADRLNPFLLRNDLSDGVPDAGWGRRADTPAPELGDSAFDQPCASSRSPSQGSPPGSASRPRFAN